MLYGYPHFMLCFLCCLNFVFKIIFVCLFAYNFILLVIDTGTVATAGFYFPPQAMKKIFSLFQACRENAVGTVSPKLMHKLSVQAPPKVLTDVLIHCYSV
jgi:hypothetical protein